MKVHYYTVSITCATCKEKISATLDKYPDIKYSVNVMEKILKVQSNETSYSDEEIKNILKKAGYIATRIS